MPYGCTLRTLFHVLERRAPAETIITERLARQCEHGLLSVGLKIHFLNPDIGVLSLIERLGGRERVTEINMYRHKEAACCLVLPPVASARAAIALIRAIEVGTESAIFDNPDVQLQVCTPGNLPNHKAALLGIGFYFASDTFRRYVQSDFETTVSYDYGYRRGRRLILYDANGSFDKYYEWWKRTTGMPVKQSPWWTRKRIEREARKHSEESRRPLRTLTLLRHRFLAWLNEKPNFTMREGLDIWHALPFTNERTDVLVGTGNATDIENVNLIATLLVHAHFADHHGYWRELGESFARELEEIVRSHALDALFDVEWVRKQYDPHSTFETDKKFFVVLEEMVAYAFQEADRVRKRMRYGEQWREYEQPSIVEEIRWLVMRYRSMVETYGLEVQKGDGE